MLISTLLLDINKVMEQFLKYFLAFGENQSFAVYLIIPIASYIIYIFSSRLILRSISHFVKRTSTEIDDILIEKKVFHNLPYIVPLIFLYNVKGLLPFNSMFDRAILALIALTLLLSLNSLLNALNDIYSKFSYSNKLNIKSYIQVTRLIINMLGAVVIIAFLIGRSPIYLLSGVGALTAVLLIIFKDTILSLVASVQISSNDLFKINDWVEAPQFGADGNVVDIALHSVKIQNWDKTISIIPTNKLIDSSFKNWKGMAESGGRRIKRSLYIDMSTIKFCDEKMIERYRSFVLIADYINLKLKDLQKYNNEKSVFGDEKINGRSLTNVGTFRAYIENYLRNHPKIHNDMTFLVRQLAPKSNGLPIEIYVFSNDTDWIEYEKIQSDIFDHLLAIVSEFDLKIFQNPSGSDFKSLLPNKNNYSTVKINDISPK